MIVAPTPCYFVVKAEGETASQIISDISPTVGHDIVTVVLVSADFDNDILAINNMEVATTRIAANISSLDAETRTRYNPLYVPGEMGAIDEMLNLDPRNDGIRFVGMSGNPFLLKTVEIMNDEEHLLTAKVEYRPFDIPGYSDIVESNKTNLLN